MKEYEDIRCTDVVTCCEECQRCGDECDGIVENMKNPKENFMWMMTEEQYKVLTDKASLPRYTHGESYGKAICGNILIDFVRAEEDETIRRIDLFLIDEINGKVEKNQLDYDDTEMEFPLVRPNQVYKTFEEFKDSFENMLIKYASGAKQFSYNQWLHIGSLLDQMKCEPELWQEDLKVEIGEF